MKYYKKLWEGYDDWVFNHYSASQVLVIDIDKYENLGFDVSTSDNYYTNGGVVDIFTNRTGSDDEILYSDKERPIDIRQ